MNLAIEQQTNLDGDYDDIRQAISAVVATTISATTVPAATVSIAGGAAATATLPTTKKDTK